MTLTQSIDTPIDRERSKMVRGVGFEPTFTSINRIARAGKFTELENEMASIIPKRLLKGPLYHRYIARACRHFIVPPYCEGRSV